MTFSSESLIQILTHQIWIGLMLVVALGLMNRLSPNASASNRYRLAAAVFWLILVLPLVALLPRQTGSVVDSATTAPLTSVLVSNIAPPSAALSTGANEVQYSQSRISFWGGVATLLGTVALINLLWLVRRVMRTAAFLRNVRATGVKRQDLAERLRAIDLDQITVIETTEVDSPMVMGVFRPVILIPTALVGQSEVQPALIHEAAHIARRDPVRDLLQRIAIALFWFHPALHWLRRHLVSSREQACDDWVVNHGESNTALARGLVSAYRASKPSGVSAMGINGGSKSQLEARIDALLSPHRSRRVVPDRNFYIGVGFLLLTGGGIALTVLPVVAGDRYPPIEDLSTLPDGLTVNADDLRVGLAQVEAQIPAQWSVAPQIESWHVTQGNAQNLAFEMVLGPPIETESRQLQLIGVCTKSPSGDVHCNLDVVASQSHAALTRPVLVKNGPDAESVDRLIEATVDLYRDSYARDLSAEPLTVSYVIGFRRIRGESVDEIDPVVFVTSQAGDLRSSVTWHPDATAPFGYQHVKATCFDTRLGRQIACPDIESQDLSSTGAPVRSPFFADQVHQDERDEVVALIRERQPELANVGLHYLSGSDDQGERALTVRFEFVPISDGLSRSDQFKCRVPIDAQTWTCEPEYQYGKLQHPDFQSPIHVSGRTLPDQAFVDAVIGFAQEVIIAHPDIEESSVRPSTISADCRREGDGYDCSPGRQPSIVVVGRDIAYTLTLSGETLASGQFEVTRMTSHSIRPPAGMGNRGP